MPDSPDPKDPKDPKGPKDPNPIFDSIPNGANANSILAIWLQKNLKIEIVRITRTDDGQSWRIEYKVCE